MLCEGIIKNQDQADLGFLFLYRNEVKIQSDLSLYFKDDTYIFRESSSHIDSIRSLPTSAVSHSGGIPSSP